jgi:pimeloyl-ACP methyl ester carboxylesterase
MNNNSQVVLGQSKETTSNLKNAINIHEIETKKVRVGDIDIAYKIFGNGDPVLLINGYSAPMDFWDPDLLSKLASNYTVIVFNNRGIGNSSSGDKKFTLAQFANDTSGLLDALKIEKADVIGWSMGGMVAQELALNHPDKVRKLVIFASVCGGGGSGGGGGQTTSSSTPEVMPSPEVMKVFTNQSGTSQERIQRILPLMFPEEWRMKNPDYLEKIPKSTETIPNKTLDNQLEAVINWPGTCNRLSEIVQPTLVVVGTDDELTVPMNSLQITKEIPGAVLVAVQGGGHALMLQNPEKFSNIVLDFLRS